MCLIGTKTMHHNMSQSKTSYPIKHANLCYIVNLGTLQMIHLAIHSAARPSALLLKKKKKLIKYINKTFFIKTSNSLSDILPLEDIVPDMTEHLWERRSDMMKS